MEAVPFATPAKTVPLRRMEPQRGHGVTGSSVVPATMGNASPQSTQAAFPALRIGSAIVEQFYQRGDKPQVSNDR